MSRIDELKKQHPIYALSAIDIFKMISPNQSNKYLEMLIKLDKDIKYDYPGDHRARLIDEMANGWGLDYNYLETLDLETLLFLANSVNTLLHGQIRTFTKFASYNERKLIENNDVTSYSSWEEIEQAVALADVKMLDKKLEKEIKKVYEDDTWISLRPLSLEASMKYGANTKWCTTTESGQYYARYTMRGILIYNINKKTGYKVACFKNIDQAHDNEFSWWDVTDKKIEALDSEAPVAVLEAIRNEIKNYPFPNQILMSEEEQEKLTYYKEGMKFSSGTSMGTDRLIISGGFGTTIGTDTTLVRGSGIVNTINTHGTTTDYNPSTWTTTADNVLRFTSSNNVGIGTTTPNTQITIGGNIELNDGEIVFRSNGEERARLTSNGFESIGLPEPEPNESYRHFEQPTENERRLFDELTREINGGGRIEEPNPYQELQEQLASISQRNQEQRQLSHDERLLQDIEVGGLEQQMIDRMQRLAGIETRESRLRKLEDEMAQLRNEPQPEVIDDTYDYTKDIQSSLYEPEVAEQPVLPSKPKLNIWEQIKSIIK